MVDRLRSRDSEYRTELLGFPCPLCGRSLYPISTETSVTFHCKSGHELPLLELLSEPSSTLKGTLELFLADWRRQHQALAKTTEEARKNGHLEVAEIFQRHAKVLESRIEILQSVCARSDSSKLMRVPDSTKAR